MMGIIKAILKNIMLNWEAKCRFLKSRIVPYLWVKGNAKFGFLLIQDWKARCRFLRFRLLLHFYLLVSTYVHTGKTWNSQNRSTFLYFKLLKLFSFCILFLWLPLSIRKWDDCDLHA